MFESTILYSRIVVYVKDYLHFESTSTLPMVTLGDLCISVVCSSELSREGGLRLMESVSAQDFPSDYKAGLRLGVSSCVFGDHPALVSIPQYGRLGMERRPSYSQASHHPEPRASSVHWSLNAHGQPQQAHSILLLSRKVCVHGGANSFVPQHFLPYAKMPQGVSDCA